MKRMIFTQGNSTSPHNGEIRASKPFNVKRDYSLMVADASATKLLISLGVIK